MDISDPYETSTGLVLLAYQPDSIIDDLIEQNGHLLTLQMKKIIETFKLNT